MDYHHHSDTAACYRGNYLAYSGETGAVFYTAVTVQKREKGRGYCKEIFVAAWIYHYV